MLALLLNPRVLIAIAVAAVLAFAGYKCYTLGEDHVQTQFTQYKADQANAALELNKAFRAKEQSMVAANQKVTDNYEALKISTGTAIADLNAERLRLLAAINSRPAGAGNVPSYTGPGLRPDATPEDVVLAGCTSRYGEVAEDAANLADQVTALQDYVNSVVKK